MARKKTKDDVMNLRRAQLTEAAYRVVGSKGYYNFTIKDIAVDAGLSTGLVHYYFKDKQELLFNLFKNMNSNLKKYLSRALASSADPLEKLEIFISQAFSLVKTEKAYFYILFDFWSQINRNERMRKANIKLFQSYRDECSSILTEGMKTGAFRSMDIEYTTTAIISLIQGMIIQHVIDSSAFSYEEFTAHIIRDVKRMVSAEQKGE